MRIAVVGFNTRQERPIANKKFDEERKAAAYVLELLLREKVEFISVRKVVTVVEPVNLPEGEAGGLTD